MYIVHQLITDPHGTEFSILGCTDSKKAAAAIAAAAYKEYNKHASEQNVSMITEWLETRMQYSFRSDKDHRLQLSLTEAGEEATKKVIFQNACAEQDELMRKASEIIFEGHSRASIGDTCRVENPRK